MGARRADLDQAGGGPGHQARLKGSKEDQSTSDRVGDGVTPVKRAAWLAAGEFDLRVGGKIRLEFDNSKLPNNDEALAKHPGTGTHTFEGRITRLEPMRVLAYTWLWSDNETDVTYELTPQRKDVLLTIVHRRLKPRELALSVTSGWDVHTGILADVLNNVKPRP